MKDCDCQGFEPCKRTDHFIGHAAAERAEFERGDCIGEGDNPCELAGVFIVADNCRVCSCCYGGWRL